MEAPDFELHALLGPGTALEGRLSFAGRARIDGRFEGELLGGELLVIGDGAHIRGEVHARSVIILGGEVEADVTAEESIEVHVAAVVSGALHSPKISMDKGVVFSGTCDMSSTDFTAP